MVCWDKFENVEMPDHVIIDFKVFKPIILPLLNT